MNSKKYSKFNNTPMDNNNLKISMAHKEGMKKFSNNTYIIVDPVLNRNRKNLFIMEHKKLNKIPQKAIFTFAKKNDFMDLIKDSLNEINNSDLNTEEVWVKFKEKLNKINDENEGEQLKYNPDELYNLMYSFHCKIDNFREEMLKAMDEIDLMGDILKIIQEYEKQKKK